MPELPPDSAGRRTPAKGVHIFLDRPNWFFLTVCTEGRKPCLANAQTKTALHEIWLNEATAWLVSEYMLMPDHLHLFCAPSEATLSIEKWIAFWKSCFAKRLNQCGIFQKAGFHHRLRDDENYSQKWLYVQENPVRKGLVSRPQDWPFVYFASQNED